MAPKDITTAHAVLCAALKYHPETGELTWRKRADRSNWWNSRYAGKRAGAVVSVPYGAHRRVIVLKDPRLDKTRWYCSRVAWLFMTGEWPEEDIDHADRNSLNDEWKNLRLATRSQNLANRALLPRNTSGYKGVAWHKKNRRWIAYIANHGKRQHLGCFDDPAEAHATYCKAAREVYGEFARFA